MLYLLVLFVGAGILGIIISLMEEGEFPGWGRMITCVFAAALPAAIGDMVLPRHLFFIGLALGAVCTGCAISYLCGMGIKRAVIAAAIFLAIETVIWVLFYIPSALVLS